MKLEDFVKTGNGNNWILDRAIYACIHGSRAYGTNTPESDTDVKGVAIPPKHYFYGFVDKFEQYEQNEPDLVIYDIRKFFKLASDCNPNIIEVLFVENEDIIHQTKIGEKIRQHRHEFLSQRAEYTFCGYAVSQLKRLRSHRGWLMNPPKKKPERSEYGLPEHKKISQHELDKLINQGYDFPTEVSRMLQKEKEYQSALNYYKQYQQWLKNRNSERWQMEKDFGFDCHSDDTEFLTDNGWKFYDDIDENDKLATVYFPKEYKRTGIKSSYKEFGNIEYQNYIDRFEGRYTGPMYHFYGRHTDILVTPNHRMLTRKVEHGSGKKYNWELEEAGRLPGTFDVLRQATPNKKNFKDPEELSNLPIPKTAFMRLLGWYLSDGSISFRNGKPKSVNISQKDKNKLSSSMKKFAKKYSHICSIHCYTREPNSFNSKHCDELILSVTNNIIINKIYQYCGYKHNKHIPFWIFGLSKRFQSILLKSLIDGDGSESRPDDSKIYYSSLRRLANDVQTLALHCGFETSLYGPYKYNYENKPDMYQVHINEKRNQYKTLTSHDNINKFYVQNKRIICFTTLNGTLITRRNGHIAIHGNSKHALHLVRLLRMAEEILRHGEVFVKRPDAEELKSIKNGAWSYDYLINWAEEQKEKVRELKETTHLPKKPNRNKLDELCVELVEEMIYE